jgi:Transposase, Mutator family
MVFIRARCCSDRCPSRWRSHAPGAGNFARPRCPLVLRSLLERGLRRVLIVVQDDFSGLLPITKSLFPAADVQLCVVHMQRNAKNHLSKNDSAEFQQRWRALRETWDEQVARTQFEELCQRFDPDYPAFMAELRKKRDPYLAFVKYPDAIRRSLSTTNVVEAVNGQLEIIRRNSGGYFQSQDAVKLKLGITITSLENGRWANVTGRVETCLHQLNAQFQNALRIGELNHNCLRHSRNGKRPRALRARCQRFSTLLNRTHVSRKNFSPQCPRNGKCQLAGPIASPVFVLQPHYSTAPVGRISSKLFPVSHASRSALLNSWERTAPRQTQPS